MLIDAGANIEETNDENYTPLMEAAREGHVVRVEKLIYCLKVFAEYVGM